MKRLARIADWARDWARHGARDTARVTGLAAVAALGLAVFAASPAEGAIVERIVAIVGERPILLSELRHRGRPHIARIMTSTPNATQQAAAETEMFRELLTRMIEERLEEGAADKARITVTTEEVDNGIRQVATQNKLDAKFLIAEAKRQGMTEQDYRDEIRRQVLEGKLIQLRVRGRVRITETDAKAAYTHWVKDTLQQQAVDLRIIVLTIPPGSTPAALASRQALATEVAGKAHALKRPDEFCELVEKYSEDPETKTRCGSRGSIPMSSLFPELQQAAASLKPGESSEPVLFRDPLGNQAFLVVQLAEGKAAIPPYEQVRDQMAERAYLEATERQRKAWIQELRRGVFIETRL